MKKPTDTATHLLRLAAESKSVRDTLIDKGYLEADGVTLTALGRATIAAEETAPRRRFVSDWN
jgi:hypothetical protein